MPFYRTQLPTPSDIELRNRRNELRVGEEFRQRELKLAEPYEIRREQRSEQQSERQQLRQASLQDQIDQAKETRRIAADEAKQLKEQQKKEKAIAGFIKFNIGKQFTTQTGYDYILDTPEEAIEAYKQAGNEPSQEFINHIYNEVKWPAGGVNNLARPALKEAPTGYRPGKIDPTGRVKEYEPTPEPRVNPYTQEALDWKEELARRVAEAKKTVDVGERPEDKTALFNQLSKQYDPIEVYNHIFKGSPAPATKLPKKAIITFPDYMKIKNELADETTLPNYLLEYNQFIQEAQGETGVEPKIREFKSIKDVEKANLPIGTKITINGRPAVWE